MSSSTVPAGGQARASAQLWAWEDFRFSVSARYPAHDRSPEAKQALSQLASAGFWNWKNRWLWRSMPLDDDMLGSSELADRLLEWARESFAMIAASGLFLLEAAPNAIEPDDDRDERPS